MHLQVGVRGPHLGIQGVVGISSVVFQTATLLQVGLELLPAPPEEKEKKMMHKWNLFQEDFHHCQLNHCESCVGPQVFIPTCQYVMSMIIESLSGVVVKLALSGYTVPKYKDKSFSGPSTPKAFNLPQLLSLKRPHPSFFGITLDSLNYF